MCGMRMLLVTNTTTESPGLIGEYLRRHGVACTGVFAFDPAGLPDPSLYDAISVFGSPESCIELDRHSKLVAVRDLLAEFVRQDKPTLGVCFGGQLLAQVLGAEVRRCPAPEIGACEVSLTESGRASPYFDGFPARFPMAQWHSDMFDIPRGAEWLAESPSCPHQAFSYGRALAVQFHPEVTRERGAEWAVEYANELACSGKSAKEVREELDSTYPERVALCELFVSRFLHAAQS